MIYSISKLIRLCGLSLSTGRSGLLFQLERFDLPSLNTLYKLFNWLLRHFFGSAIVQVLELLSRFDEKQEMFFRVDLDVIRQALVILALLLNYSYFYCDLGEDKSSLVLQLPVSSHLHEILSHFLPTLSSRNPQKHCISLIRKDLTTCPVVERKDKWSIEQTNPVFDGVINNIILHTFGERSEDFNWIFLLAAVRCLVIHYVLMVVLLKSSAAATLVRRDPLSLARSP